MDFLEVNNVSKSFGKVKALDGVSFSVGRGEVFGLIGPDGAGKTTLFRLMATLLLPDSGSVCVDGFDTVTEMRDIRRRVGYMPGKFSLYQDLTVEENLKFFATLFNTTVDEGYDSIKAIYSQIEPFRNRKAGALSGGMKQKLALSCALIHQPSVLFLDEPTTGLHFEDIRILMNVLRRLVDRGNTVIVIEHNLDVIKQADWIIDMGPEGGRRGGEVLNAGTPKQVADSKKGFTTQFLKKELERG